LKIFHSLARLVRSLRSIFFKNRFKNLSFPCSLGSVAPLKIFQKSFLKSFISLLAWFGRFAQYFSKISRLPLVGFFNENGCFVILLLHLFID